jgi:hypothetical protein
VTKHWDGLRYLSQVLTNALSSSHERCKALVQIGCLFSLEAGRHLRRLRAEGLNSRLGGSLTAKAEGWPEMGSGERVCERAGLDVYP